MSTARQRTAAVLALVPLALAECLPGDDIPPAGALVHNDSEEHIWLAADTSARFVLLELDPNESGEACLTQAGDVDVYAVDPELDPRPPPAFTLPFGDEDFCDGTFRWDGDRLEAIASETG